MTNSLGLSKGLLPPSALQGGQTRVSAGPMWGRARNPLPPALRNRAPIMNRVRDAMQTRNAGDFATQRYAPYGGFNQTPYNNMNRQLRQYYADWNRLPGFEGRTAVPDIPQPQTQPQPENPATPANPQTDTQTTSPLPDGWDGMNPAQRIQWLVSNGQLQLPNMGGGGFPNFNFGGGG